VAAESFAVPYLQLIAREGGGGGGGGGGVRTKGPTFFMHQCSPI